MDIFKNMTPEEIDLGSFLSAALDDPLSGQEFKDSINNWFKLFETKTLISVETLEDLKESEDVLDRLYHLGVDEWEHYDEIFDDNLFKY